MMFVHESNLVRALLRGLALLVPFAVPGQAAAQSPAAGPDEAACQGKQSGDACTLVNGNAGTCGPGTCSRLDYSGGSPPKATEEPCTVCVVGHGGPPTALGGTGGAVDPGEPEASSGSPSAATTKAVEDAEPPKTSSRCSVIDRSTPSDLGWLGLFALGLGLRRRR